ncbi:MAG TPA: hypothetical protein P5337_15330, partial [Aestuariivirga sp.]|nr:hypothetical protein [Aestuariivirga sp.]
MAATPYPIPRSARQTAVLTGNGGTTYGPYGSGWGVFDVEDVRVWWKPAGQAIFTITEAYTVTKSSAAAYDTFSIEFDEAVPASTSFYVEGHRVSERAVAITSGGTISSNALEKELSKIAVTQQELARDTEALLEEVFGEDGNASLADRIDALSDRVDAHEVRIGALELEAFGGEGSDGITLPNPFFMVVGKSQSNAYGNELAISGDWPDAGGKVQVFDRTTLAWKDPVRGEEPFREASYPSGDPQPPAVVV